jgi:hypothetical protein
MTFNLYDRNMVTYLVAYAWPLDRAGLMTGERLTPSAASSAKRFIA